MSGDDEHGSWRKHGVRAPVLVVHVSIEHVGDDLLCQVRMEPHLDPFRRDRFGEPIERRERTLLGGRHEKMRRRIGEVLVTRTNHDLSKLGLPRHRITGRPPTDVFEYLTTPCARSPGSV